MRTINAFSRFHRQGRIIIVATVILWFLSSLPVSATSSLTWDGGSLTDDNWSTAENWVGDTVPLNDGTVGIWFDGSPPRLTPNLDTDWNVFGLLFWNPA